MVKVRTWTGIGSLPKVALPNLLLALGLAFGRATGATPMTAVASAMMGGPVIGAFGDSAFIIVGPVGALVGVLMRFTAACGAFVLP